VVAHHQRHIAGRDQTTFASVARRFIAEHCKVRNRGWRTQAKLLGLDYVDGDEPEIIKNSLCDRWQSREVATITDDDLWRAMDEARRVGIPGLMVKNAGLSDSRGRHLGGCLSKLFAWLSENRIVARNPSRELRRPKSPPARDRVLATAEVRWLWKACDQIDYPFGTIAKILLLSGQRRSEVSGIRWSELSDDGATWNVPSDRTKNKRPHAVPLSPLVRDLIASVPRRDGVDLLFTMNGMTPSSGFSVVKKRIDALMMAQARDEGQASIAPWRTHDLRRTAATGMAEIGTSADVVEVVLNHISGHRAGVAGIYNKSIRMEERRSALERWASHVEGIVSGRPARVVAIRGQR
jgi:integrase